MNLKMNIIAKVACSRNQFLDIIDWKAYQVKRQWKECQKSWRLYLRSL